MEGLAKHPIKSADKMASTLHRVYDASKSVIDGLSEGEKISMKELVGKVSNFLEIPPRNIAPLVAAFVETYDNCTVVRGRHAGVYKGVLEKKHDDAPRCEGCGRKIRKKDSN